MAHALLSPSSASRWLACTPSARLEEKFPDTAGEYAAEGSLAHELCELLLHRYMGGNVNKRLAAIHFDPLYSPEMYDHAVDYADTVWNKFSEAKKNTPDAVLHIEESIDLQKYVPEGFGTGDAVIISGGVLEVIDYKYGKGVEVSAVNNKQMMLYALGTLAKYDYLYGIDTVRMTIIQPRIGNISEYEMRAVDLYRWAEEELKPRAMMAYRGEGEFVPGNHCRFCRAKAQCRALAERNIEAARHEFDDVALLSDEEVAAVLEEVEGIKSWITAVEEYALKAALDGKRFPGFKLVEGRSIRKYRDSDEVAAVLLAQGFKADQIYKPRELQTITAMEKLLTKKGFNAMLGDLIIKPAGKPTLVPLDDRRPEWSSAEADFKNIIV